MKRKKPIGEKQQYDPSLSYEWSPEEKFEITGMEFEYIFKSLTEFLNSPESVKVLRALETHQILEAKLKEGVEKGKIKPQKQ